MGKGSKAAGSMGIWYTGTVFTASSAVVVVAAAATEVAIESVVVTVGSWLMVVDSPELSPGPSCTICASTELLAMARNRARLLQTLRLEWAIGERPLKGLGLYPVFSAGENSPYFEGQRSG